MFINLSDVFLFEGRVLDIVCPIEMTEVQNGYETYAIMDKSDLELKVTHKSKGRACMVFENFVEAFMGKGLSVKEGLLIVPANCFQGCNPDTPELPSRCIDDSLERKVVIECNHPQIGNDILDFHTLIELHAAKDFIGNALLNKLSLDDTGKEAGAVQDSKIGE